MKFLEEIKLSYEVLALMEKIHGHPKECSEYWSNEKLDFAEAVLKDINGLQKRYTDEHKAWEKNLKRM